MTQILTHTIDLIGAALAITLNFATLITGSFFNSADLSDADNSGYVILF